MASGTGWECELCHEKPARLFCLADDASLCWTCDASVHAANFLVARHLRSLLCHSCASPTGCARNGPWIRPNSPLRIFCSNCSSLQSKPHTSLDANPSSSSSSCSSSSTISFAAASSSCNGSAVNSCNRGRKRILSVSLQKDWKIESSEKEEEDDETTSGKENHLGISNTWSISSTTTFPKDRKLGSKGSSSRCNLNRNTASFENKWPRQKNCKSSLSVSRQKYCKNGGSDEEEGEEEEKEVTLTNEKLSISDAPSTSSTSKPADELGNKDTSAASK